MAEFHNTKRVAIINKAGSGKSTLARYLIESEILSDNGYWITDIWTNGEIYSGDMFKGEVDLDNNGQKTWNPLRYKTSDRHEGVRLHKIMHMKELEESKNGIQYLDEMLKCLPARRSGSQYNLIYGSMMSNIRKIECHFIGTDQYRKGGDIFIRTNIEILLVPIAPMADGKSPLEYWVYDGITDSSFDFLKNPPNPFENALEKTIVPCKNIWNLFKTKDILPLSYDVPFGVKEYTADLSNWRLPSGELLGDRLRDWTIRSPELKSYMMLYEEIERKHLTEPQRRALTAYLDTMGLLKKWERKQN